MILKNLVANALKFTPSGEASDYQQAEAQRILGLACARIAAVPITGEAIMRRYSDRIPPPDRPASRSWPTSATPVRTLPLPVKCSRYSRRSRMR